MDSSLNIVVFSDQGGGGTPTMNKHTLYANLDNKQELFLRQKVIAGSAEATLETYKKVFDNINSIVGQLDYENQSHFELQVLSYFETIFDKFKPTTYNIKRRHLTAYFNFLKDTNQIEDNPVHSMKIRNRKEDNEPRPADTDDLKTMLSAINLKTYTGFRDYTFITLIVDTGIRPSECVRLTGEHIDLDHLYINLTSDITKTSRPRSVPLSNVVAECICKLFDLNHKYFISENLFLSETGQPVQTYVFQKRLKYYSDKLGIKITPYQLRHYFGTQYLKNQGGNLIYLQKLMGHADISMTKRYVQVDKEALSSNHKLATPLQNVVQRNTRVRKLFK